MKRGERRARTERIVKRRLRLAKSSYAGAFWEKKPGMLKKRAPVCNCRTCRTARKPQGPKRGKEGA